MNRDFIDDRKTPRFEITWPENGESLPKGKHTVMGTYRRAPANGERFNFLTRWGNQYYPHGGFRLIDHQRWECDIHQYNDGEVGLIVAQFDPGSALWIDLYLKVGRDLNKWIGLGIEQLPAGIRLNHQITITIKG
jgi:hypothetical protein